MTSFERVRGQQSAKAFLEQALAQGRLAHTLLFDGPDGVGKELLALELARRLLCVRGSACGECPACKQVAARVHPDLHVVRKQAERRGILLEQVHEVQQAIALRPLEANVQVAIIADAHDLSFEAQDALLKTLEEPPPSAFLILVTHRPQALRSTVRSRCQRLRFERLGRDELEQVAALVGLPVRGDFPWQLACGQMTRLRRFLDDDLLKIRALLLTVLDASALHAPVTLAARWAAWAASGQDAAASTRARERERARESLLLLLELARDACLLPLGVMSRLRHMDLAVQLSNASTLADPERLDDLCELVFEALNSLARNVDTALVLEYLTLSWGGPR
ncbi:MAG: hypothetical protein U1E76_10370 [Planctomycetota bacterium]